MMGKWKQVVKEKKQTREHETAMARSMEADTKPNKFIIWEILKRGPGQTNQLRRSQEEVKKDGIRRTRVGVSLGQEEGDFSGTQEEQEGGNSKEF